MTIIEASDEYAWTVGNDYEFLVHDQYRDKDGVLPCKAFKRCNRCRVLPLC